MIRHCASGRVAFSFITVLFTFAPWCRAGTLFLPLAPNGPTVQSINGTLAYNSGTGQFTGSMQPLVIAGSAIPGGLAFFDTGGETRVDLFTNSAGQFVSN